MAITIKTEPNNIIAAYNTDYFILQSTNSGTTSFAINADLEYRKIGDTNFTKIVSTTNYPNPQVVEQPQISGEIEISPNIILENFTTIDLPQINNIGNMVHCDNIVKEYRYKFTELTGSAQTILTGSTITGQTKYFWNSVFNTDEYNQNDILNYIGGSGSTDTNFFTNNTITRPLLDLNTLYFWFTGNSSATTYTMTTNNYCGNWGTKNTSNTTNIFDCDLDGGDPAVDFESVGPQPGPPYYSDVIYMAFIYNTNVQQQVIHIGDIIKNISFTISTDTMFNQVGSGRRVRLYGITKESNTLLNLGLADNVAYIDDFTYEHMWNNITATSDLSGIGIAIEDVNIETEAKFWTIKAQNVEVERNKFFLRVDNIPYIQDELLTDTIYFEQINTSKPTQFLFNQIGTKNELEVYIVDSAGTIRSEKIRYRRKDCTLQGYTPILLTWLNSKGGFDQWLFNTKTSDNLVITRNLISKPLVRGNTKQTRELTNYTNKVDNNISVITGYLTQEELDYISEILYSTDVYEYTNIDDQSSLTPIVINTNEINKFFVNGTILTQLEINFTYSKQFNSR